MDELITKQIEAAKQLHAILVQENAALQAREAEEMQSLSAKKAQLTEQLEQLSGQQSEILSSKGLPLSREGLSRYARQLSPGLAAAFQGRLQTLTDALEACKKQNLINGQMIAASRQSVEVALSILRGQNGPRGLTYGPGGETLANNGGNSLAKA